jgi:hypothetical protein
VETLSSEDGSLNGGKRALIVSILLFLLWGTFICAPFRNFVRAIRWLADQSVGFFHAPAAVQALLVTLIFLGIATVYLLIRYTKTAEYSAVFASAAGVVFHLGLSVVNRTIAGMAIPVVIGLAAAVIFMLFQADQATLFLGDAYFYALPVYLFYELVMIPVFLATGLRGNLLSPFITVNSYGLATDIGNLFGIPAWVWGTFLFVLTLLPVLYLSKGRAPKKRDYLELSL